MRGCYSDSIHSQLVLSAEFVEGQNWYLSALMYRWAWVERGFPTLTGYELLSELRPRGPGLLVIPLGLTDKILDGFCPAICINSSLVGVGRSPHRLEVVKVTP